MEVTGISGQSIDGKIEVSLFHSESVNNLGYSIRLSVWVPESDSRAEIAASAISEVKNLLSRVLSDHSS